jgi:hypothetical protein
MDAGEDYAEFPTHLPGRKYTDFKAVREEIDNETTRLLGNKDKDISDLPIHLTIYSQNVLYDIPTSAALAVLAVPAECICRVMLTRLTLQDHVAD